MLAVASEECYEFACFRVFPKRRKLFRGTEPVVIGGRAFDLLLLLASRAGEVIGFHEIMAVVWPNITVEEANLRVQIGLLRKVLSSRGEDERAIETIPLRGYCFILPVRHYTNGVEQENSNARSLPDFPFIATPIIGRESAIDIISTALDERQLVTVTGPGGIGKTTVAIAIANRYAAKSQGAVGFADLSHVSDGTSAAQLIAQTMGLEPEQDPLAELCIHFRNREALLILDTCEHIVEPMARLVETVLNQCANLRLLVTSREALRATGEWTHRLPSLTFPENGEEISETDLDRFSAMTLFIERVQSSMRFAVRPRDLPMLAEICRRLDGIPLALEFAAARVTDLGLREIAAHLDNRFSILTRGRRTALPRHRTLAATFDWSYSLLSESEQSMLKHLSMIGVGFTAEHAIQIGSRLGCERPTEAFSALYEKSLLTVEMRNDEPIFRLLDTTRAYMAGMN